MEGKGSNVEDINLIWNQGRKIEFYELMPTQH